MKYGAALIERGANLETAEVGLGSALSFLSYKATGKHKMTLNTTKFLFLFLMWRVEKPP